MNNKSNERVISRRLAALLPAVIAGTGMSASAFAEPGEPDKSDTDDSKLNLGAVSFSGAETLSEARTQSRRAATAADALAFTLGNTSKFRSTHSGNSVKFSANVSSANVRAIPVDFESGAPVDVVVQPDGRALALPSDPSNPLSYGVLELPTLVSRGGGTVPGRYVARGEGVAIEPTVEVGSPDEIVALKGGFSYTATYNSKDLAPGGYVSMTDALKELKRCFSCSFPIKGATKAFPKKGVTFPLVVSGGIKAPVKITQSNSKAGSWQFTALKGHFDAAGSTINFNVFQGRDLEFVLGVTAKVKGTKVPEFLNKTHAKATWRKFTLRTCQNAKSH
ncbi:hypothetical protein [Brachybacterium kimchii]|uniref:Uncharacterized protein n=1 Tax=Brachybacterium kimchii TaxID=2942909 RepID=A0ABY4N8Q4_9MICO|nr:hypothetical protein [Brachybacterium kimchii]UQN30481.1 hypothetical protein M4486_03825 [Brachybacterium kimchii]